MSAAPTAGLSALANRLVAQVLGVVRGRPGSVMILFTAATLLLRLASNATLTRILPPYVFGVMGVIASAMVILTMLSDLGYASFVIRHERGDDPRFIDVTWTIRLGQSVLQAIAMVLLAAPFAAMLGKDWLTHPIASCAPVFVLNALCPMSLLVAQRHGRVKMVGAIELGALIVQIALNVGLATVFMDYRALIVGLYAGALTRIGLALFLLRPMPRLSFERALATEFFGFSRIIMVSSILTLLITQADKVLFARLFPMPTFAVYAMATNLALSTQPFGRNYVQNYFFPLVSRVWREAPDTIAHIFYRGRGRAYRLLFAGFGFATGFAPVMFAILFDWRYEYGWVFMSVLMVRCALDLDSFIGSQTLMAMGFTATTLRANVLRLILFAVAVAGLFRPVGPIALPLALAIAEAGAAIYIGWLLHRHRIFKPRLHAAYAVIFVAAFAAGGAISMLAFPGKTIEGLARMGR